MDRLETKPETAYHLELTDRAGTPPVSDSCFWTLSVSLTWLEPRVCGSGGFISRVSGEAHHQGCAAWHGQKICSTDLPRLSRVFDVLRARLMTGRAPTAFRFRWFEEKDREVSLVSDRGSKMAEDARRWQQPTAGGEADPGPDASTA